LYNLGVVTLFGLLLQEALNHCMLCFNIFCIDRRFQAYWRLYCSCKWLQ